MNLKNTFNWLLAIFASTILIYGAVLLLKEVPLDKINLSMRKAADNSGNINISAMPLPGFVPAQQDDSMDIHFPIPDSMSENEAIAKSLGVYKLYKSTDSRKVNPESIVSISFCKKKEFPIDLQSFIVGNSANMRKYFPGEKMEIGQLRLPADVVKKLEDMSIPYQAVLYLADNEKSSQRICSCAIFYFETPGGFWSINWTAPREILVRKCKERDIFLGLIKFMTIGIARPDTKTYEIHM